MPTLLPSPFVNSPPPPPPPSVAEQVTPLASSPPPPVNGIKGWQHWRHDLAAGFVVSLVSLPLSLAIAVASGAPPSAGLLTAIVGGVVLPLIGGSYMTIASPAAGMAPVLYQAVSTMGRGNLAVGYPLVLPLIILTGLVQLGLSRLPISRLTQLLPPTVITGMLFSIGLIVLVKQLPLLLGHSFVNHSIAGMLLELPTALPLANPSVALLGMVTLLLIAVFAWLSRRFPILSSLPPFFYALVIATVLSQGLSLAPAFLLPLPLHPLEGLVWPNFTGLLQSPSLWGTALSAIMGLLLVNTVESLATLKAVDQLDPYRRQSNVPQSILGVGACNIASAAIGGLTVVPEVMRSTVNVAAGARTQWASVWNGLILLMGWLLIQPLLTQIPLTVLAAVLMVSSFNLCKPSHVQSAYRQGGVPFVVFLVTVVFTLWLDLMWGLLVGTALGLLLGLFKAKYPPSPQPETVQPH